MLPCHAMGSLPQSSRAGRCKFSPRLRRLLRSHGTSHKAVKPQDPLCPSIEFVWPFPPAPSVPLHFPFKYPVVLPHVHHQAQWIKAPYSPMVSGHRNHIRQSDRTAGATLDRCPNRKRSSIEPPPKKYTPSTRIGAVPLGHGVTDS